MILLMILKVVVTALLPRRSEFQSGIDLKHRLLYRVGYFDDADTHAMYCLLCRIKEFFKLRVTL